MQMENVNVNENPNQQDTAIKEKEAEVDCQNQQLDDKMDIEEQNLDDQNEMRNNETNRSRKKRQSKIAGLDPNQIIEGKRERKPQNAIIEQPPSPKKNKEKKQPQKYQISNEIEVIQQKISQWDNFKNELQQLGFPSIILDFDKINEVLKEQEKKDEATKNYNFKMLILLFGEGLCCVQKAQVNELIQKQLTEILEKNQLAIDWTQEYWDEQIKSFIEIKHEFQSDLVQDQESYDFNKLHSLTQNEFPIYVTEKKFACTFVVVKAKKLEGLSKFADLNELKNIRKIREYIVDLYCKLDQLKNFKKKIEQIKKLEDEADIIKQYDILDSAILTLKNKPIKFEPKTEIKAKSQTQQKQKQKVQTQQEQQEKQEIQENDEIQGDNHQNQQIQQNQSQKETSQDNKTNDSKQKKKKEKEEEKKVCTLDRFSFKRVEIQNPQRQVEQFQTNETSNKEENQNEEAQQQTQTPQLPQTPSQQQVDGQFQEKQQINNVSQVPQLKSIKHFFQIKKQQEVQKQEEFQPKTLPEERMSQFDNFITQLSNGEKSEFIPENINNNQTETETKLQQYQKVRIRKISIFLYDSKKQYNGHQFLQLSQNIRPRQPFQLDDQINYNEDSEAEVEELAAENISNTDNSDDESSDDGDQKDSFLVEDDQVLKNEVDDPEELLNNQVVANQTQNQNGIIFIKFLNTEPEYFVNYKATYVQQYFQAVLTQQQKEQTKLQGQTTLLQNQQNQVQLKSVNLLQQSQIPVAKMCSSTKKQIKQKPKTQKNQQKQTNQQSNQQKQSTEPNENESGSQSKNQQNKNSTTEIQQSQKNTNDQQQIQISQENQKQQSELKQEGDIKQEEMK